MPRSVSAAVDRGDSSIYRVQTVGEGPPGRLPLDERMLRESPSGDLFGMTQAAGMGWDPAKLLRDQVLILGTKGGIRDADGRPIALGYHTGHWEIGALMTTAARELDALRLLPFAAFVSDPCDGRSQGTPAMMDSLAYRNDAAVVLKRLIRSLPLRKAVIGVATCDKGLPAMMMALAEQHTLAVAVVPGGVTLPARDAEDAGKVQAIGARFAHGEITLEYAAEMGCRACGSPGGGCQFLGTAATSQVVAEAIGLAPLHSALAPSGQPAWHDAARRAAHCVAEQRRRGITARQILTPRAIENAMAVHAAFGGSTNLLLHIPAIAFAAGLSRPTVDDWERINRAIPRLVDVLPNGPQGHPTVRAFLAGGVPEVMLHLRSLGLIHGECLTCSGHTWDELLDWWQGSERRARFRELLAERDGISPDEVIYSPDAAAAAGLTSTVCFPRGNVAPEGSVIKSTAIDPSVVDADGVYRKLGRARVFVRERDAVAAIKGQIEPAVRAGDVVVLAGRGPMGAGMEETYQITSALRYLEFGKHVAVVTDARFSGVSTGACIGHVGPEALAGGPIGKLRDGDWIRIEIDRRKLQGRVDFVGEHGPILTPEQGATVLARRPPHPDLAPDPQLPPDTRLWAALQQVGGGTWGGCVYDPDAIIEALRRGLQKENR
ncbi:MAG: YjhG/YagF family D-xylonate dehydratase [Planctomycetota bacterium]|nr:MAG: YjhG/YagF family D-xylonate dehydratase [Planctomycetota bacterium]